MGTKTVVLNVRMTPEERDELAKLADADDRSIAGVVRQAMRQYVAVRRAS